VAALDGLLAARTGHESKGDTQGRPLMFEELHEAVSVKEVSASKPHARLLTKLARVADIAKLVRGRKIGCWCGSVSALQL